MIIQKIACVLGILTSSMTFALSGPLGLGHGVLLYDATQAAGPASPKTNDPGQWISNIQAFNLGAVVGASINRLYVYSGDVEYTSSDPDTTINVLYDTSVGGYGQASVARYRPAFPNALILAIIDGNTNALTPPLSYYEVGNRTAANLALQICSDPNVDGVFFDLEPFDEKSLGQFGLYQRTSYLFQQPACIDALHPNGRYFGIFLSPNSVKDWGVVQAALGSNGFLAVAGYDLSSNEPTTMAQYTASLTGRLQIMDLVSRTNKIPYTVVIPAAASFQEFSLAGIYDPTDPPDYFQTQYFGFPQINYIQTARGIIFSTCTSPYFMGADYWSWSQYKSPPHSITMFLPAIPPHEVVEYLQGGYVS